MILGLTGGIASGKTTVSKIFKKKDIIIYDADVIAKELLETKEIQNEIKEKLGEKYISANNEVNKSLLKKDMFRDKKILKILNGIIHPKVIDFYKNIYEKENKKLIVFDIPLLFEVGLEKYCDKILVVITSLENQIERIKKRDNISEELAKKIISTQMRNEEKIKKSDYIIENNKTLFDLENEVLSFLERIEEGIK